jgi:hypothetical protein
MKHTTREIKINFHSLPESRIIEMNKIKQKYDRLINMKAIVKNSPFTDFLLRFRTYNIYTEMKFIKGKEDA